MIIRRCRVRRALPHGVGVLKARGCDVRLNGNRGFTLPACEDAANDKIVKDVNSITSLDFSRACLKGRLIDAFSKCPCLTELHLGGNKLKGPRVLEAFQALKPVGSLPPIHPANMHGATYGEMVQEERQEKWLSKTKRMAQEDFVTATGRLPLNYPGSVHVATGYNPPPASLARGVDKSRWTSENDFKTAVPSNRLVDPAADKRATREMVLAQSVPAA